jgi:lysozyme family protein
VLKHERTPLAGLCYASGIIIGLTMLGILELVTKNDPLAYESGKAGAINKIREHEGGWSNEPNDAGGKTNFGVSTLFLNELHAAGRWLQYNTVSDIPNEDAATKIFEKEFFIPNEVNYGKNVATLKMHDIAVNLGGKNATMVMQRTLNDLYQESIIDDDGRMGDNTRGLFKEAFADFGPEAIAERLAIIQDEYYTEVINADSSQGVFEKGWRKRATWIPSIP